MRAKLAWGRGLWVVLVWMLALWVPVAAHADDRQEGQACAARVLSVAAARAASDSDARPTQGWEKVVLPNVWTHLWPGHSGSVWYRIDWERGCADLGKPVALGIDGISVTGEVFINDDLLWRDVYLVEPLSRSWNVPRWWLLPQSSLHEGVNTVWVRAVGPAALSPGLGAVRLGDVQSVALQYENDLWQQRTVYSINAVLCAMASVFFLLVWCLRREESAYGWFGLMALGWLAYLSTYLATTQWPWPDSISRSRFSSVALIWYVLCACMFTFRYGEQRLPRVERMLWGLAALGSLAVIFVPVAVVDQWFEWVWQGTMAVFLINCLQFQWHAWRHRPGGRQLRHMLLAVCWMVFVVVALRDLSALFGLWQVARSWAAMSGLLTVALVMLVLGGQLVQQMRSVERFNWELAEHVARARAELAQAVEREHAKALEHAKLQERMDISHDLHDGLGSSLVRSMALVEQTPQPLSNDRVMSLLKVLRDDLRQVIDHGSAAGASVPANPKQWAAPLRHRFKRILDEMEVDLLWQLPDQWRNPPSALQCLALTRLLEEALSNVIKHSRASQVHVVCTQDGDQTLNLRIADNGVGFDVGLVKAAGLSVGVRSMHARMDRVGARLSMSSRPGATVLEVRMTLL
jgi:two-component system sensor histidine kinase UhpB